MRAQVFVTQPIAPDAATRLRSLADVEMNTDDTHVIDKEALIAGVKKADILFSLLHDTIDRDVLAANPRLRAVTSMCVTPDRIDVEGATERRIPVTVIPPIVAEATADMHFSLLLAVARRLVEGDHLVRQGVFPGAQSNLLAGRGVYGKMIGIIGGRGRIGQAVARRARGFGMRILYCGPHRAAEADEKSLGMTYVSMSDLLENADFVSVHAALKPETHHLIGRQQFLQMKPSAFLINTSRGPIVEEAALVSALRDGLIAGAGLDVFENEPFIASELTALPNVVLTPHMGSAVLELREMMAKSVIANIEAILRNERPPNCINPEVYN